MKDMASNRFAQRSLFGGRFSRDLSSWALVVSCSLIPITFAHATDITWTNNTGGSYEDVGNWNPNAVPTSADRAIFSNTSGVLTNYIVDINANEMVGSVLANESSFLGTVWRGTTTTWTVNNSFIMDQTGRATNFVRSTTVTVTNNAGTGLFSVGNYASGGFGVFRLERVALTDVAPQIIADAFRMTSNSTVIDVRAGTITTGNGGTIIDRPPNSILSLENGADTLTWNMTGGSNAINNFNSGTVEFAFANNGTMNVNVSGPSTTWYMGGGIESELGWNGAVHLTISAGAKVTNNATTVIMSKNGAGASNNTVLVTGTGSQWNLAGELRVGSAVRVNSMTISDSGVVNGTSARIGENAGSSNNTVVVSGSNSVWNLTDFLQVGSSGKQNSLIITNGGRVNSAGDSAVPNSRLGLNGTAISNSVQIDGNGSIWNCSSNVVVGNNGSANFISVKNGGQFNSQAANIGAGVIANNNFVLVDGPGSLWIANGTVQLGVGGNNNQLTVSDGGEVVAGNVDVSPVSGGGANNSVLVSNATLFVTNSVSGASLRVGGGALQGTFTMSSGSAVTVDKLFLTNGTSSAFVFNGGVLNVKTSVVANGSSFVVGNGTDAATLNLLAFSHSFANNLSISPNATLSGVGTINANVTLANNATLAPGLSGIGTQTVVGALVLNPSTVLDYALGAPGDGGLVNVMGNLTLDGTINVINLGGITTGSYTLFSYTGLTDNTLTVGTLPAGVSATVSNDTVNQLILLNVVVTGTDPFASWQSQYFTPTELANPNFSGPNADPFGKGMSNTNQFLAGFNPTNATAYVHIISIAKSNAIDIVVGYLGASGDNSRSPALLSRTNVLEFTTGTANGSYNSNNFASTGATNILSGGVGLGTISSMVDPGGATNKPSRYYRVRVLVL
jgi:T5SS/PEP-CTERM-associated repeat protein